MKTKLKNDAGTTIVEYAVILAVILVVVVGTARVVGSDVQTKFSQVVSSMQ